MRCVIECDIRCIIGFIIRCVTRCAVRCVIGCVTTCVIACVIRRVMMCVEGIDIRYVMGASQGALSHYNTWRTRRFKLRRSRLHITDRILYIVNYEVILNKLVMFFF